jgi:acyl carrier protein
MGLDTVELLVEVEKTFGIDIPNLEAAKIVTVGDFHNTVWRYVEGHRSVRCKSQHLFYKLRHKLINSFGILKDEIMPDASLNEIFPKPNRRRLYTKLGKELNLKLPELVLPAAWTVFLNTAGFILIAGSALFSLILVSGFDYTRWVLLLPLFGILGTLFLSHVLDPVRTVFNPSTVKAFAQVVLSANYASLTQGSGPVTNRKEVESIINHVIARFTGLDLQVITPDKSITSDLGLD